VAVSGTTRALIAVLVVALAGVVAAIALAPGGDGPTPNGTRPTPGPTGTPPPAYALEVTLGRVWGRGPSGIARPRELRRPAATLRATFTELYAAAFVDPDRWHEGSFPGIGAFFARSARAAARKDLRELTLGRTARRLDAVRPRRARLDIRFVTDRGGHALVAFADMSFTGIGLAGDARVPISQRGRFVLRRADAAWRIDAYDVRARIPPPGRVVSRARSARFAPPAKARPLFVLVIGSDARPGQLLTATRADSLHIVSVNPRLGRGAIVGIPRDSYVPIPGHGTAKINAALFYGGPDLVVRTVERLTGVHIDAYLLTGFDGFHRVMDGIGGIDVRVPYAMDDANSGAHFRPGRTHLNGREALAFSRDRHDAPGGDLGRSLNQGRVLLATLQGLRSAFARDPARLLPWIVDAGRFVRTDLSLSQMTELLLAASTFESDRIRNTVVYGSGATVNGQSIVRLGSSAYAVFRDVARDGVLGR
jgi:LCP family protein required for cell wall assembly